MVQTKAELEEWYKEPDPWGYRTNPDDEYRKKRILQALDGPYRRALDIGCGEGWITKDLPAKVIHGLDLSEAARSRIPAPAIAIEKPFGKYDLIVITGVLYKQYDYRAIRTMAMNHLGRYGTILTCHIKDWEQPLPVRSARVYVEEFPYRQYTEVLRRYQW